MTRDNLELRSTTLSAEGAAALELGAAWRRTTVCRGCGQRPLNLTPVDAVTAIRRLQRRGTSLLRLREESLVHRGAEPGSWSAMEPVGQVPAVLRAADILLRHLFDEDPSEAHASEPTGHAPPARHLTQSAVLAALARNATRLIATIDGCTAHDWDRSQPGDGGTASELVWLALHDATHHLEDAELLVDAALRTGPVAGAGDPDEFPSMRAMP